MINPVKQKYMYTNPLGESIYIKENNNIYKRINTLLNNNALLQIKGHGSKINNINWKLFFGVDTKVNTNLNLPDKINVANFNQFNYTVSEWFRTNLINIESYKVVIQYDGDKLLEDNYKNSDTLLQNYTGVLIGLIYYLLSLGKEVHILCILDNPENKWNKNIDYYWENGFNQMSRLGVDIHFWIYDLIPVASCNYLLGNYVLIYLFEMFPRQSCFAFIFTPLTVCKVIKPINSFKILRIF